jgi:hypothetical protein
MKVLDGPVDPVKPGQPRTRIGCNPRTIPVNPGQGRTPTTHIGPLARSFSWTTKDDLGQPRPDFPTLQRLTPKTRVN